MENPDNSGSAALGNVNAITDSFPIAFASQREASEGVLFVVNGH
jgi:hypothetical protein